MLYILLPPIIRNRYTENLKNYFEKKCKMHGILYNIVMIKRKGSVKYMFTDLDLELKNELYQIQYLKNRLCNGDKVFIFDVDIFGLLVPFIHYVKLKGYDIDFYGYFHGGIWCNKDIFAGMKGKKELSLSAIRTLNKIFVATQYHKNLIEEYYKEKFDNIKVIGFFYDFECLDYVIPNLLSEKKEVVGVVGRIEQSNKELIEKIERFCIKNGFKFLFVKGKNKLDYYRKLNECKVVVSVKEEETFGISMFDAYFLNCIILCPNRFAYKEIWNRELLYDSEEELFGKIYEYVKNGKDFVSIHVYKFFDETFENLVKEMNYEIKDYSHLVPLTV